MPEPDLGATEPNKPDEMVEETIESVLDSGNIISNELNDGLVRVDESMPVEDSTLMNNEEELPLHEWALQPRRSRTSTRNKGLDVITSFEDVAMIGVLTKDLMIKENVSLL